MEKILRCVKKGSKIKVAVDGETGFVQFPSHLREENKIFKAKVKFNGKFWKLESSPRELTELEKQEEVIRKNKVKLKAKLSGL